MAKKTASAPKAGAKKSPSKKAAKKSSATSRFDVDHIQKDFKYMIALYRDQRHKPLSIGGRKEPRYCEFDAKAMKDFVNAIPEDGTLRIYYGLHFKDKNFGTPQKPEIRSSTDDLEYISSHTLILCKVDKNGDDILEITKDKPAFLVAGNKSPMNGGSLCPPKSSAKAKLMNTADLDFPTT